MKFFSTLDDWGKKRNHKRIQLVYEPNKIYNVLQVALQPNNIIDFDTVFFFDFSRNFSDQLLNAAKDIQFFLYEPRELHILTYVFEEIYAFKSNNPNSKIQIVLNDWESLWYLFQNTVSSYSLIDLMTQLKFLSDIANITILVSAPNSAYYSNLHRWSNVVAFVDSDNNIIIKDNQLQALTMNDLTSRSLAPLNNFPVSNTQPQEELSANDSVKKSSKAAILGEAPDNSQSTINKDSESIIVSENSSEKNASQPEEGSIDTGLFTRFVDKLTQATNRDELLVVRQEIQAQENILTSKEKMDLSEKYRIHLQRIKKGEEQQPSGV